MAPHEFSHVALPLDARASSYVRCSRVGKTRCCAQPVSAELDQELDSMEPFWDRKPRYNKKEYRRFIDELDQWGLINWVTKPQESALLLCVWKKHGISRRRVVDARRTNRAFKEGFSRWEVPPENAKEVHVELAVAGVDNCFHHHRMHVEMSAYFCLQPLPLKYTPAGRGRSLTMGFAWSLCSCTPTPLCLPPALASGGGGGAGDRGR